MHNNYFPFFNSTKKPYQEVPVDEPVPDNTFSSSNYGVVKTYDIKSIDSLPICELNSSYDGKLGKIAIQNAPFVGAIFDPADTKKFIATGILITPNLFLTTGHYSIPGGKWLNEINISFDYEAKLFHGTLISPAKINHVRATLLMVGGKPGVDFAIFRLNKPVNKKLMTFDLKQTENMVLIHHGNGLPKTATSLVAPFSPYETFSVNFVGKAYAGSSGAPLFSDTGGLYAIYSSTYNAVRNAITIKKILSHLLKCHQNLYYEILSYHSYIPNPNQSLNDDIFNNPKRNTVLTYEQHVQNYRSPRLEIYHVFSDEELRKQKRTNLNEENQKRFDTLKKKNDATNDKNKQGYIDSLRENIPEDPFTDKFKKDHVYSSDSSYSKNDNSRYIANTRSYSDNSGKKLSTMLKITEGEGCTELENALDQLETDKITGDTKNSYNIKYGTFFNTKISYEIYETPILFGGNGKKRSLDKARRDKKKFTFGIRIKDNEPKIHHFEALLP